MDYQQKLHDRFDHAGRDNPALQEYAKRIQEKVDVPDELAQLYAYLALTSGSQTSNEDVHDAWAYWTAFDKDNPDHKSMKPFDELDQATQDLDAEYRDAIRQVAEERTAHFKERSTFFNRDAKPEISTDFLKLFPKRAAEEEEDGPTYYLWVFDPQEDKVHVEHNEDRHPADHVDHSHLAKRVVHPDRIHGFAYRIRGGWRITTWEHRPVDDPHVLELVRKALKGQKHNPVKSNVRGV
jgi:hypothetical protein